jgi:hypothetical protein
MKPKHWLLLCLAAAAAAESVACSSSFKSCNDSRTCAPTAGAGTGGQGDAGDASNAPEAGAPDESESAGQAGAGGEGGDGELAATPDAGASGEAGGAGVTCDASVDLKADPKNCGSCGHDCLGGECDLGKCQPFTIVPAEEYINDFVIAGEHVYWSGCNAQYTDCLVMRRRSDASDTSEPIAPSEGLTLYGIAAGATQLLWAAQDHVRACVLPNCEGGPQNLVTAPNAEFTVAHFASASQTLFWTGSMGVSKRKLMAFSLTSSEPVTVNSGAAEPSALASDDKYVYWNEKSSRTATVINPDGALWRARLTDLKPALLASGLAGEYGQLVVGSDSLYFAGRFDTKTAGGTEDAIFRIPLPNGIGDGALPIFVNASVNGMFIDRGYLYWLEANFVKRCPLTSCSSPEIVLNRGGSDLKEDTKSLYWREFQTGGFSSIVRVAK